MRTVLNLLGLLLAGLAIGYVLASLLDRLARGDGRSEMALDFPPGSEAQREWRRRASGLKGTSPLAL